MLLIPTPRIPHLRIHAQQRSPILRPMLAISDLLSRCPWHLLLANAVFYVRSRVEVFSGIQRLFPVSSPWMNPPVACPLLSLLYQYTLCPASPLIGCFRLFSEVTECIWIVQPFWVHMYLDGSFKPIPPYERGFWEGQITHLEKSNKWKGSVSLPRYAKQISWA